LQETQQLLEQKLQTKEDQQWDAIRLVQAQSMISMVAAFDSPTSSFNKTNGAHHPTTSSLDALLLAAQMASDINHHAIAKTTNTATTSG
jgi:hypothetical protein